MTKSNARTLDYPQADTVEGARAIARKVGKSYATAEKSSTLAKDKRTGSATMAVKVALDTGLLVDGQPKPRPETAMAKGDYGRLFGLNSGSEVSYWITLAVAVQRFGMVPGDATWKVLAGTAKLGKRSDIAKAIRSAKTLAALSTAIQVAGFDPETGEKATTTSPATPRGRDGKGADGEDSGSEQAASPFDSAKAHLKAFHECCKSPTIQAEEYDTLRGLVNAILVSEDKRRGVGTTRTAKRTTAKRTTAAPARTGTDG